MKLNKEQLLDLQKHIDILFDMVGFERDTYEDIHSAITKAIYNAEKQDNLITHFDQMGSNNLGED